jgi:hypothetical protein
VDITGRVVPNGVLLGGSAMTVVPLTVDQWNLMTPSELRKLLKAARTEARVTMDGENSQSATYAFKTREGGMGLLQILGASNSRNGVKIRYKLVQSAAASVAMPGQTVESSPPVTLESLPPVTLESLPPVVVRTEPASGARDVAPGIVEILVRFSKEMADGSWSWTTAWTNSAPEVVDGPRYDQDHRTCVIKAKLEPGRTYAWWLNSEKFQNFKDKHGNPAVPYLLIFQTRGKEGSP